MYAKEISNEEVNGLPLLKFEGDTELIEKPARVREVCKYLSHEPYIGFDTETKPNFVKGRIHKVALVQFATDKEAFLIRTNKIGVTKELVEFMRSDTLKVGVALHDDVKALQRERAFEAGGIVNINKITAEMGIVNQGIRKLAAIILGGRVSKSQQLSNWEAPKLTPSQQNYAATDAWVGWKLYDQLLQAGAL